LALLAIEETTGEPEDAISGDEFARADHLHEYDVDGARRYSKGLTRPTKDPRRQDGRVHPEECARDDRPCGQLAIGALTI
jgi:hypothetical protein